MYDAKYVHLPPPTMAEVAAGLLAETSSLASLWLAASVQLASIYACETILPTHAFNNHAPNTRVIVGGNKLGIESTYDHKC